MISPNYRTCLPVVVIVICASLSSAWAAEEPSPPPADGTTVKAVLDVKQAGANLVKTGNARPYEQGFRKDGTWFLCDNGTDPKGRRGVAYGVTLNQTRPEPVIASGWSKASNVTGSADSNFAVYVDLLYTDGTHLYGQTAPFNTGTHDWEKKQVVILPDKPVRQVNFYLLLREHGGQAWFRDPEFHVVKTPKGSVPVRWGRGGPSSAAAGGFSGPRRGGRIGLRLYRPGSSGSETPGETVSGP